MHFVSIARCVLAGTLLAVVVAGCSGKKEGLEGGDSLLRYVPADTPYVFATGEPLPDDLMDALEPHVEELLAAYRKLMRETYVAALSSPDSELEPEEVEKRQAVAEELLTMLSLDSFEKAGIDRNSQMVLYGNGVLPVIRIEVQDEAAFDDLIDEIETSAGEELDTLSISGTEYRYIGDDEAKIILGVDDGNAVFALLPAVLDEAQSSQLLALPGQSILSTNVLSDLVEEYGFTNHYVGFIDSVRLASGFLDQPTGVNAALMQNMDFDPASISPVCKQEIMDVVSIMPRVVFGYDTVSLEEVGARVIVELRQDIAAGLTNVAAVVPGLGIDQGGLFSFGVSANLLSWREFYEARLDALEADPFNCEYFEDLQAGVEKGRQWLAQPIPPLAYGFRGFNAVVSSIDGFDLASKQPPESVEASVVLAIEDAQSLVGMGAMFVPQIASMNLQADGEPVALELPQVDAVAEEAYAAMLPNTLAIAVGTDAKSRARSTLEAESANPSPVFAMTMDAGKYYELIGESMMIEPDGDEEDPMSPEAKEAVSEIMTITADIYDRMLMDLQFTEKGAVIRSKMTLDDL